MAAESVCAETDKVQAIDFITEVRPIFAHKCYRCHGPDRQRSGLRLDVRQAAMTQGMLYAPNIAPGDSDASPLIQFVGNDGDLKMPPEGPGLTDQEIATLRAWVDQGAIWPDAVAGAVDDKSDWWAWQPLCEPLVPAVEQQPHAPRLTNAIDSFVVTMLHSHGLRQAPRADRRTLIRRLYFDLIGLPPSPDAVETFVDDTDPNAYERLVDRLLASPRYGERWARHWMDAVHFAETHGHDQDRIREHAWPYRDYLIASFNADKPYSRFIQEQVAGDALFPDDPQATIALGFLAAGPWDESSLRDIQEDTVDRQIGRYLDRDDMLSTVMNNVVSLTVQCARCHDHKFDPIPQKDYYAVQAWAGQRVPPAVQFERIHVHRLTCLELPTMPSRREFLQSLGGGFGAVALADFLAHKDSVAASSRSALHNSVHHAPRAQRVIQLFMNGGASQIDLFDHKPMLHRLHGQAFDPGAGIRVEAATSAPGKVLMPPVPMRQRGESGRWVSDLLPHLANCVDDLAFFMALKSRTNVHGPGSYLMNTGFLLPGFPCLGSWVSYALGTLADNLPAFVVLPDARGLPYNQKGNFSAGFLSAQHQGTVVNTKGAEPIAHLAPPPNASFATPAAEQEGLALLDEFNRQHAQSIGGDPRLEARIEAYELAAKMQLSAPQVFNLSGESATMHSLYGLDDPVTEDFGRRCLLARRMIERGVRFVQVWSGAGGPTNNWDNHASIRQELPPMCAATDKPIAGLLIDLKQRGLLDDTLVLWNTEFGRMPFSQGGEGRDHNGGVFSGWMCGAGVKPGISYGESDPWSWQAAADAATTYDFHATVLHLLGIDHEQLTVRNNGANRRLTDVHGNVIHEVLLD